VANPFGISAKADIKAPMLAIQRLKRGTQGKILRPAVGKGIRIIAAAARAKVKAVQVGSNVADRSKIMSRLGLLALAMGAKIYTTAKGAVIGVAGPRRGFKTQIGVTTRKRLDTPVGTPIFEDPANIAHLVELGHGGPHPAGPHPFMRPAVDETSGQVHATVANEMLSGIARLAKG
jgi:HK97 gp10 family phage protein